MLNNRILISSIVLAIVLLLTARLVTARTEVVSDPSNDPAAVVENQQSTDQNKAPIPSYRSPLDECFDVSLREAANCRNASQVLVPSYRSPLDECFDVSLREVASCRNSSQAPPP
jgi:hypothetical protein